MSILLKIEIQSLHNVLSLLRPIDTRFSMWVAYIKTQLGIATQVSVNKVNVTVGKKRNSAFTYDLSLL
jgi:hypothetical protein